MNRASIISVAQAVRMFCVRLKLHKVYYVDNTNFNIRDCILKHYCNCWRGLPSVGVSPQQAIYNIRFTALVVTCPFPDTDTLSTVFNSLLHSKPLLAWMLRCYHIRLHSYGFLIQWSKHESKTVCIRWKVQSYNVCFLVCNMV